MQTPKGPIVFNLGFIGVGNVYWTFFPYGDMAFLKSENVLSPGGRLLCSLVRGPFVFNLRFIGVGMGVWGFKNTSDDRPF